MGLLQTTYAQNSRIYKRVETMRQNTELTSVQPFRAQENTTELFRKELDEYVELDVNESALRTILDETNEFLELTIPVYGGGTVTVELAEVDFYLDDYIVALPSKQRVNVNVGKHYRGIIKNDPKSIVSFSFSENNVKGLVMSNSQPAIAVEKMEGRYVSYIDYKANRHEIENEAVHEASPDFRYTAEEVAPLTREATQRLNSKCVRFYVEMDYNIYQDKGGTVEGASIFMSAVMNQVVALYENEDITTSVVPFGVWTEPSPYTSSSTSGLLGQFQSSLEEMNADLGILTSYSGSGGIAAGFNGLCNSSLSEKLAFASITDSYSVLPTYSFTVQVITHELGHLFGSRHTHACVWNGNSTAIDSCPGFVEGYCEEPGEPEGAGSIMSYCHNTDSGIDLSIGFGEQPGNVIRNRLANADCISSSCSGSDADGGPTNLNASDIRFSSFNLSWSYPTDTSSILGYEVFVDGESHIKTVSSPVRIVGLSADKTYKVKIRGYGLSSYYTAFSDEITVTTKAVGGGSGSCSARETKVDVKITTDKYGSENSWEIKNSSGRVVASGNNYSSDSQFVEKECLPDGCYTFIINDEYGDGMCCEYGNGGYEVFVDGRTIASGGDFQSSESKEFCIGRGGPTADTTRPTTPRSLSGRAIDYQSVKLTWSASSDNVGVTGYEIYQNGDMIGKVSTAYVTIDGLSEDTSYRYYIKAYDAAGNKSYSSTSTSVRTAKRPSSGCKSLEITITTDKYGSETSWEVTNTSGTVVYSGNGYGANQTYTIDECIADGCYTFKIMDSYKDGMCCQYGNGSYQVKLGGRVIASGGEFGEFESESFCTNTATTRVDESIELAIYPNPVAYGTNPVIQTSIESGMYKIVNFNGQVVQHGEVLSSTSSIDVQGLNRGNYILIIENNDKQISKQLSIQ